MRWEELPMASRARLMAAAVRNGYTDIRSIKEAYANYQDQKQTTGNRYDEGGEFEVVNLLDNAPVEYNTEDTGYTPWFIQNTEHAPDNPMTNQQYYSLMEKVATENNPIWNTYRKEKGLPELTVDEEYTRILNDNSYDYRGYYNDPAVRNSNDNANTHWPDEYKTAYHPTFSTYSLYSGMVDPNYNPTGKNGGLWFGDNYVNYNKNVYGGNLFNNGGAKNQNVGGVKGLLNLFDKYHIPYKQTSGLRKGAKTASGHASYHSMTDVWGNPKAVDITGDFNKIKEMAYSNPEIVAYMRKEGLGILEETTSDVKKKTHATGDHFHIGPDKWAIQMRDNNINKYNVTYHPMQDVTWSDVQERKQQFELTPEEETLLGTSALATYNPEYVDRNDLNYRSALADAVALDESLDESLDTPANNWAKWNAFLSMQSGQSDPVSSYSAIQQKEEPSLYQLFAPQGDDYMYHGLNFAAYGGKVNKFDDGGFSDLPEQRAYRRAVNLKVPYTNYEDAVDMDDSIMLRLKKFLDKGVSNCTLTASQLFNPNNPIGRARTIVNDSINNGFYEIDADHVIPGTMVIASHPEMSDYNPEQNYHTMIVTGFAPNDYEYTFRDGTKYQIKKGEPLVSYSRGKASADNYVHDVPLSVYNANSKGKTYNRYYRPIDENYPQVMVPEITITR